MGKKGLFITVTFAFHVNIKESREKTPDIFVLRSWLLVIRWLLFDFHSRYIYQIFTFRPSHDSFSYDSEWKPNGEAFSPSQAKKSG